MPARRIPGHDPCRLLLRASPYNSTSRVRPPGMLPLVLKTKIHAHGSSGPQASPVVATTSDVNPELR